MSDLSFLTRQPIAHRGLHDGNNAVFENSMGAMLGAVEHGYAIELDVQLSNDDRAMVFHDSTLDRVTASQGALKALGASDLAKIKLGGTNDVVNTLEEVLGAVGGKVPVVIEMKGDGNQADAIRLANAVADAVQDYDGEIAVMSFEHDLLQAFRDTGSKQPLGLTAMGMTEDALEKHRAALDYGIEFVSFYVKELPNAFVSEMRETHKMPVITWTVRTPEDVELTKQHADQMTFEGFLP
ncbi:glycerophosphodiester phosphodiesterase family protein [Ahrensia sp. 13_GOM-1096m]|uniref:glycerophosphodiester phosphodiesterase family protein n=1 Tax=Ahrensia sp. 13_GOM-1096m TaxID=1380380 RepID=UPI00047CF144|nr:glycerophosphodiester phosphodiesterase family protein [Ahrensia sp. 13_GOM-1096m]